MTEPRGFRSAWRLPLATLVALVVLGSAAAATGLAAKGFNWRETSAINGSPVMAYQVTRISVTGKGWSAHVAIRNLSKQAVFLDPQFELDLFPTRDPSNPYIRAGVSKYTPALPGRLAPGKSWSGVLSSTHALKLGNQTLYARIVFGHFYAKFSSLGWSWMTDHALRIESGSGTVI